MRSKQLRNEHKKLKPDYLEQEYIDTSSPSYIRFNRIILWKYDFASASFLLALLFLSAGLSSGCPSIKKFIDEIDRSNEFSNFDAALLSLIFSIICFLAGYLEGKKPFSFQDMIKDSKKDKTVDQKFLKKIQEERKLRIQSVSISNEIVIGLFTFFVVDVIADEIHQAIEKNLTIASLFAMTGIIIAFSSFIIFFFQRLFYWIIKIIKKIWVISPNHGTFVYGYTVLTAIEYGLSKSSPTKDNNQ